MAIILDEHLKIYNTEMLAEYIKKKVKQAYGHESFFTVIDVGEGYLTGVINGVGFVIYYNYGINCSLEIQKGFPETEKRLINIIEPVMWKVDEEANNPAMFTRPLFSYFLENSKKIEWDVYDPFERLKILAFDIKNGLEVNDLKINYKNMKLDDFDKYLKFGSYTGYFSGNDLNVIENYTEIELFLNLKAMIEKCENLENDGMLEEAKALSYNVCYLMQKAKKFGVKVNAPSDSPPEPTTEFLAWVNWWSSGISKELKENPDLIEKWAMMPKSYDPNFRPSGSFKDNMEIAGEIDKNIK